MIKFNGDIIDIKNGNTGISAVYNGTDLVWKKVSNSFICELSTNYMPNYYDNWLEVSYEDGTSEQIKLWPDENYNCEVPFTKPITAFKNGVVLNDSGENTNELFITRVVQFPDLSKVEDFSNLFNNDRYLNEIKFDIRLDNAKNLHRMFYNCYAVYEGSYNFSNWDVSNVEDFSNMFEMAQGLMNELDLSSWHNEKNADISWMFGYDRLLTSIDISNIKRPSKVDSLFANCFNLETVKFDIFDLSDTYVYGVFAGTGSSLTNLIGEVILDNTDASLSSLKKLSNDSAMVFINGAKPITRAGKITFYSSVYNTLSSEQIAIATSKGWTVASS